MGVDFALVGNYYTIYAVWCLFSIFESTKMACIVMLTRAFCYLWSRDKHLAVVNVINELFLQVGGTGYGAIVESLNFCCYLGVVLKCHSFLVSFPALLTTRVRKKNPRCFISHTLFEGLRSIHLAKIEILPGCELFSLFFSFLLQFWKRKIWFRLIDLSEAPYRHERCSKDYERRIANHARRTSYQSWYGIVLLNIWNKMHMKVQRDSFCCVRIAISL